MRGVGPVRILCSQRRRQRRSDVNPLSRNLNAVYVVGQARIGATGIIDPPVDHAGAGKSQIGRCDTTGGGGGGEFQSFVPPLREFSLDLWAADGLIVEGSEYFIPPHPAADAAAQFF